jgi:tetratricopeptide (TPR) repeat protein
LAEYYEWISVDKIIGKLSEEDKLSLVNAYLAYWNSYYDEEKYALKALKILNTLDTSFSTLYLKWYANEIQKNYGEARRLYIEAKGLPDITLEQQAIILNQIWHTYDLEWDYMTANEYYIEAENTGIILSIVLLNRWRYEFKNKDYEKSEAYLEKSLELSNNNFMEAEVLSDLSAIYLAKWWDEDLKKVVEYAEKWIEIEKDYLGNYLNLGVWFLALWRTDEALEPLNKALNIYPLSAFVAKNLGIYYFVKWDYEKAIQNFELELANAEKDITIMWYQRKEFTEDALYNLSRSYAWIGGVAESIKYLDRLFWDWNNSVYYLKFLWDLSFQNISQDKIFKENFAKYFWLYYTVEWL